MKTLKFGLHIILYMSLAMVASCGKNDKSDVVEEQPEESPVIAATLSNQQITAIAEDAQGHIWIGTFRGLNKYSVHEYHQYFCTDDSTSLPDNHIMDMMRDSKGHLWVSTVNGLCMHTEQDNFRSIPQNYGNRNGQQLIESKDGRIFVNSMHQLAYYDEQDDSLKLCIKTLDPYHTFMAKCHISPDNRLWVATPKQLVCYDVKTMQKVYSAPMPLFCLFSFMQSDGTLWLAGNHKVMMFDTYRRKYKDTPASISGSNTLANADINAMRPYGTDGLLISTDHKDMLLYNYAEDRLIGDKDKNFPFNAPQANVTKLFTDSQDNLWIGTYDHGCDVRYSYKERFNTDNYLAQSLSHTSVTSVACDKKNNLWIGTFSDGVYVYNLSTKDLKNIPGEQLLSGESTKKTRLANVFVDNNDNIWIRMFLASKILKCKYEGGTLRKERSYDMFMPMSLTQDEQGTIWVGTSSYMLYYMKRDDSDFKPANVFKRGGTFIPGLLPMGNNRLWVAAFMQPVTEVNTLTGKSHPVTLSDDNWHDCIRRSVFIPTAMYKDSKGDVWIGTVTNGLLRYTASDKRIRRVPGTPCTDISSIEEDEQGNVWVSTLYGLAKYNRADGKISNYFETDGIGGNQFNDRASCHLQDGTLVFGGTHGLTVFNPVNVGAKRTIPLLFEDLKIHNKLVQPAKGQPVEKHLSYKPDIHLKHYQNGFSISFAALDYREHDQTHYFYKLDGVDKYWVDAHNNREAYYANIPAGHYTFTVKVTDNDMNIAETEESIQIIVSPAPWLSWWAWCLYIIAAAVIVYLIVRTRMRIKQEEEAARRAQREKEQEQRVNKMNMSFFANISHEFRTPLTTISGPIKQLCNSQKLGEEDRHMLHIVSRSVQRMLRLVNQLLDFNKLENDTLRLQVKRTDIIPLLKSYADMFALNAKEKGVTLTTRGLEDAFVMWLDADKLDKIVVNLMSNALKFTPHDGNIELAFDANANYAKVTVSDTGCGLPEDKLEQIFERYYQLNNQPNAAYNTGTGIGLYYSRSLARLHHGSLTAANRKEGHGAVFTLLLPTDEALYADSEHVHEGNAQAGLFPLETDNAYTDDEADDRNPALPSLLVVDDDAEVVHYMKTLLSKQYSVMCCFDAATALRMMSEQAPDLVVSDVAMPETNGYELCRQIKEDLQLCHIPVILVTAKATVENQVEGLNTGADAYVTKPFDPNYLMALIQSLLKNREKMRHLLSQSTQTDDMDDNVLSPQDHAFMTDLYQLMESELANSELDIAHMTKLLCISRTKFYYKVKGLTGESPSVFFKTYKLNRAAELIKEGKHTVSEIAYMTGFSTPSHFSTVFKKQFGVAPSEYGK